MVEGPGATRNGKKAQVAVGQRVISVPPSNDSNIPPPTQPQNLVGELSATHTILEEAFSIGKEVFLIFTSSMGTETALRLHFGMNGSLSARKVTNNNFQKNNVAPWKKDKEPSLRLYFGSCSDSLSNYVVVEAWETTVSYPVSATHARTKCMELISRDVCAELFNAQDMFTAIRESGNSLIISDALLNQDICPGVGNIIKIESLHRSKVDPRRRVSSLTDPELRRIIRHTRKFSMDWYKTGRAGKKLVYNQTICGTCQGMTVKMQKIGGESQSNVTTINNSNDPKKGHAFMSRVTFWCSSCQPNIGSNVPLASLSKELSNQPIDNAVSTANNIPNKSQCPQHWNTTKLSRARKENANHLRIFYSCKKKSCQHFAWADSHFPNCKCGKKTVLRVSKTERSGGQWFLCCASGDRSSSSSKGNGCGHFEWAKDDVHLTPIRSLLTPLL